MTPNYDHISEKARNLYLMREGGFNVPPFIFISAEDFGISNFGALEAFLKEHCSEYKVIARSAHPREAAFKGGSFESLETYADVNGIVYARNRIIRHARTRKRLSIRRQQRFDHAPDIDLDDMGVVVMPYIDGYGVMAKKLGNAWEFGYSGAKGNMVEKEPFITQTPHDRRLVQLAEKIQAYLGFKCEIEFLITEDEEIHVVQAKDISNIKSFEEKEYERSVRLDGIRRVRKRRNYRERPIFMMDNKKFYLDIVSHCEDIVLDGEDPEKGFEKVEKTISEYEADLEQFALTYPRFCVVGVMLEVPEDLFQVANSYLDDTPDLRKRMSNMMRENIYKIDQFIAESDTLVAQEKYKLNLATHDAYGVDSVRNPVWHVHWRLERHEEVIKTFHRLGFRTGDLVAIEIDAENKPVIYRI